MKNFAMIIDKVVNRKGFVFFGLLIIIIVIII